MTFTAIDLVAATFRANASDGFPMVENEETAGILHAAITPALNSLSPHLRRNDEIRLAMMTVYTMGIAAGLELERGS